jgi:methylmalonyl-CoA/ethylmalonyl-CoA epimerase
LVRQHFQQCAFGNIVVPAYSPRSHANILQESPVPSRTQAFHHGGVSVPDLEASIRWYREVLGFEVEHRFEIPKARRQGGDDQARRRCAWSCSRLLDGKLLPEDRRVPDRDLQTHGNKHVCFGVQSVDAAEQELRAKGVDIVFVGRAMQLAPNIFMRDNSGNLIEFIEQPDLW